MVCRQGKLRHEVMIRSGSFREAVMLHQCLGLDQSNPKNRAIPKKKTSLCHPAGHPPWALAGRADFSPVWGLKVDFSPGGLNMDFSPGGLKVDFSPALRA